MLAWLHCAVGGGAGSMIGIGVEWDELLEERR